MPGYIPPNHSVLESHSPPKATVQEIQLVPRSPYLDVYDHKVHFNLPNTLQTLKSPIPGLATLTPDSRYIYRDPFASAKRHSIITHTAPAAFATSPTKVKSHRHHSPEKSYYNSGIGTGYFDPNSYVRNIHALYNTYQDERFYKDHILALVKGPVKKDQKEKKEKKDKKSTKKARSKSEPSKPFHIDRHFDATAFMNLFKESDRVFYYLQLVAFKVGEEPNSHTCEHMLFRPIKEGKLTGSQGILVQFVEQNKNKQSTVSRWSLESQPDFDPTSSKKYVGYKNIGFVPSIERFLDLAVFLPVPLDGTSRDPVTGTLPLSSFQAWSAIVFMEANMRNFLIPHIG